MKKPKQFTIAQLEAHMQESLNFIFGCKAHISHGYDCTMGNRKLYGKHTHVAIPIEGHTRHTITRKQQRAAAQIIAYCYDKVTRVVLESGTTQYGSGNAPVCRTIRFEHE